MPIKRHLSAFSYQDNEGRNHVSLILKGVQQKKSKIVLTREAILFDRVKRLFPVWGNSWSYQQIRKSEVEKVEKLMKNSSDG